MALVLGRGNGESIDLLSRDGGQIARITVRTYEDRGGIFLVIEMDPRVKVLRSELGPLRQPEPIDPS